MRNPVSLFADEVTALPPLHAIHDFISKWRDIYVPGMPPMSPVTNAYFTSWTLLDAAFGVDKETICTAIHKSIDCAGARRKTVERELLHPTSGCKIVTICECISGARMVKKFVDTIAKSLRLFCEL